MNHYWLSFVDTAIDRNLGCCIIEAANPKEAVIKATNLGINPGGEVMCILFSDSLDAKEEIQTMGVNRLISREELISEGYKRIHELPDNLQDKVATDKRVNYIHDHCNNDLVSKTIKNN